MTYKLDSGNFKLIADFTVYENEMDLPINASFSISVDSEGFRGFSACDVNIHKFAALAEKLKILYETHKGSLFIEDPRGSGNCIRFTAGKDNSIKVEGVVCYSMPEGFCHEFKYNNEFDRSFLEGFSTRLYMGLKKYLI